MRILATAGGIAGAVALSQFPEFSQQYVQRLSGATDELRAVTVARRSRPFGLPSGLTRGATCQTRSSASCSTASVSTADANPARLWRSRGSACASQWANAPALPLLGLAGLGATLVYLGARALRRKD